ncbi:uncharacterized protein LTR77_001659 [Saxophila tyrrhenica]|uniref:Vps72/YL1 C-terminal domain-containing protein n=1 Tax=Saxophila tyrrhenica TaxID=1690608 RepID=A0AAV9PNI4_9PEZI|nr:hypothetical protein LTR77_001659 [Saxophila tyrrhenica]
MSDDERSDSGSESDDLVQTGLVATRQKRATAGNFYAALRNNLDDEELQKELLAEDEEDAGEYESSDKDVGDEDEAFDSSSDDEDAGPPQEGQQEDLEGEKALKKQERNEAKKKRKAAEAKLRVPALRKVAKRVKLADDVKAEDGTTVERPKKKSERSNWLPSPADAPLRQSGRSLAVSNREIVHENLKQSAKRSEQQKRIMKNAAEREKTKQVMASLTQEERLKKCERIEKETAKEFGKWEREEAERQRLRDEALAAKRNKGFDGPMIRHWSGSVLWEGERIKVKRVAHGSRKVEEIIEEKVVEQEAGDGAGDAGTEPTTATASKQPSVAADSPAGTQAKSTPEPTTTPFVQGQPAIAPIQAHQPPAQPPVSWLQGIQEYASQPSQPPSQANYTPSAPSLNGVAPAQPPPQQPIYPPHPPQPHIYHGWPPGSHQFTVQPQPPIAPPPAPILLIREQAQRTLLILSSFPNLDTSNTTTKRIPKSKAPEANPLDPTPIASELLPSSHPPFTSDERTYLLTRPRKRAIQGSNGRTEVPLPPPPAKQRCAVTSWPAKFRDPKTGLAYADMHQYKVIQRVLAGGTAWSRLLGAWVGPRYGALGRPARGVPEGFGGELTGGVGVKSEVA